MKTILCPTDFSDCSVNAIAYASQLALNTGCRLTLMKTQSVLEPAYLDVVSESLELQAKVVKQMFNVECDYLIDDALKSLSHSISDCSHDYDVVVMGTDGPDGIFEFFAGTNAFNASQVSRTPFLIIPNGVTYSKPSSIAYAFDYLRNSEISMATPIRFARDLNCGITLVNVVNPALESHDNAELLQQQRRLLNISSMDISLSFETVASTQIGESIHEVMLRNNHDILALCQHKQNFIERFAERSITKYICAAANYPIYLFHK